MAKSAPVRLCLGCREPKLKIDLLRIVKTNDGNISLDMRGKLSGRGAYICRNRSCFDKAYRSKALDRSLGITIPAEVYDTISGYFDDIENG